MIGISILSRYQIHKLLECKMYVFLFRSDVMGMPGPFELIIILVIVLLIFGGKRLKNIGNDLGGAIKGFRSSMKESESKDKEEVIEAKVEADDETNKK